METILEKELEFKISLCYSSTLVEPIEIYRNNPIFKLLSQYREIENIIKMNRSEILKFLYFNRKNIEQILYYSEEVIRINSNMIKSISNYFYLTLLINQAKREIIYYEYSFSFIKEINVIKSNSSFLEEIVLSKTILELIRYFSGMEEYEENIEKELIEMENYHINRIKENINNLKELNLESNQDNISQINIDEIYIDIISSLIKTNKIDDFKFTYNIINQLDLENICITEKMFNDLSKVVDTNKNYMNNYKIEKIDDLFVNKKINFYFILIKYILKYSFYIYQIEFLNEARKTVIKIITSNSKEINDLLNKIDSKIMREQILYVIKEFLDSEYLFNKYIDSKYELMSNEVRSNNLNENSSNLISFEAEKENEISSHDISSKRSIYSAFFDSMEKSANNNLEIPYKIMNNSSFKFHINNEGKLEYDEINYDNDNIKINYDDLKKLTIEDNEILKKNFDKFLDVLKSLENQLEIKFQSAYNFHFDLLFKMKNINDNSFYYNISCLFLFYCPGDKNPKEYKKEDILSSKSQDILSDILIEQFEINKNQENERNAYISYKKKKRELSNKLYEDFNIIKEYNKDNIFNILQFKEIIAHHYGEAEFIVETSNGICISGSSRNELILFNESHEKKKEFIIQSDNETLKFQETNRKPKTKWTLSLCETKGTNQKNNELNLISCSKIGLKYININIQKKNNETKYIINENNQYSSNDISQYSCSVYLEMGKDIQGKENFIIGGEKGIRHFSPIKKEVKYIKGTYRGGIKLNNYVCAFTSNSVLPKGKDKLIIYDIESKKIIKEINNYSFTVSSNSLAKIKFNDDKSKKCLLCGCKKYFQNQKNGILLIDVNSYIEKFYDTDDFEVYCFCRISSVAKTQKKKTLYPTNYFFVGGFEERKQRGMIKLYRIIEEENKTQIEFVQDIIFEEEIPDETDNDLNNKNYFVKFKRNISSIVQSKLTGEILITSWDGNVYLFSEPNIIYYLDYDKNELDNGYCYLKYDKKVQEKEKEKKGN